MSSKEFMFSFFFFLSSFFLLFFFFVSLMWWWYHYRELFFFFIFYIDCIIFEHLKNLRKWREWENRILDRRDWWILSSVYIFFFSFKKRIFRLMHNKLNRIDKWSLVYIKREKLSGFDSTAFLFFSFLLSLFFSLSSTLSLLLSLFYFLSSTLSLLLSLSIEITCLSSKINSLPELYKVLCVPVPVPVT